MIHVSTTVNGDAHEFLCDPRETLLDALRDRLELTGAKEGCGTGDLRCLHRASRWPAGLFVPRPCRRSART